MPRPSNSDKLRKVHQTAMEEFDRIVSDMYPIRKMCLADRRFCDVPGAQWEGALSDQFANRPMLEVNKTHLAVIRVENDYRNNRITADFVSRDGIDHDGIADTCDGLFRADEQDSNAQEAYDNAFSEGLRGGFGAWRLRTDYEYPDDEEDTRQRIRIEPIYEADSCVFFDIDARRQDKKDANHCFVLIPMTPQAYRAEYGESPSTMDRDVQSSEFDWSSPDIVYIAEYYKVEDIKKTVYFFNGINGDVKRYDKDKYEADDELQQELESTGYKFVQEKRIPSRKIHKYLIDGNTVLEDQGLIAGNRIPIVPFYGKRWFIDGVERCMGHVRLVRDAQMLKNIQLSVLAELSAMSGVEKPIFTPEQMAGHEQMWRSDTVSRYPYMLTNTVKDNDGNAAISGPVGYTKPPAIPPALAALLQITEQDMQDILGNPSNADNMVSNVSGQAVEMIQSRLDMQSYIYMSNFAKAIQCGGEIWFGQAVETYVEDHRKMKTIGLNGEAGSVELMRPKLDEVGNVVYENDLSKGKLDVIVEVGPSYKTQRDSVNRGLTNMLQFVQDPETKQVIEAILIMNTEGEGLSDIHEYFRRRLVTMGAMPPSDDDKKRLESAERNTPPDPNAELAKAMAEEAKAKALKAVAETEGQQANTELTRAKTLETLSTIDAKERQDAIDAQLLMNQTNGSRPPSLDEMGPQNA